MSDKQNLGSKKDDSSPAEDDQPGDQNGSSPRSYYYDDATGYEIYNEQSEDDEQGE
jgi:hypothetical protein